MEAWPLTTPPRPGPAVNLVVIIIIISTATVRLELCAHGGK
jgi:hypothetical protein